MRSTKIICTIGPKSDDEATIARMAEAGMDVIRINLSHGSYDSHRRIVEHTRRVSRRLDKYIGILFDLQGPKIRTGKMVKENILLNRGDRIVLTVDKVVGNWNILAVNYSELPKEVKKGERIFLDDGNIELRVVNKNSKSLTCEIMNSGIIGSHKGVNLPDSRLSTPSLTEKDAEDLRFGLEMGIDYVALSFVRNPLDILSLKELMRERGASLPVIAKIEKQEAIPHIDEIIDRADGIMVARGDLGVETSPQEVPILQKLIIDRCNSRGKPVITATQMLESMISRPRPTRAEASDVANAIFDGTDAVMLSGETAVGQYPVEAVGIMGDIVRRAEEEMSRNETFRKVKTYRASREDIADSVSSSVVKITDLVRPRLIVSFTLSGRTASLISKYRPSVPIIAMSSDEKVLRRLTLFWGVQGVCIDMVDSIESLITRAEKRLIAKRLCDEGDTVVLTGGIPVLSGEPTNMLKVHGIKLGNKNI